MRLRRTTASAALLAAAALLTAGCGSSTADTTTAPGSAPPLPAELDFTVTTVDGKPLKGASLVGKDTVLWFWAPWCHVCRSEAPTIEKTVAAWGDKVAFVGVAGRAQTADMEKFVSDTGLNDIPHAVDADGSLWAGFGVTAQPAFAFVNHDGDVKVVIGPLGPNRLSDEVERLTLK